MTVEAAVIPAVVEDLRSLPESAARAALEAMDQLRRDPGSGRPLSWRGPDSEVRNVRVLELEAASGSPDDAGARFRLVYELVPNDSDPTAVRVLAVTPQDAGHSAPPAPEWPDRFDVFLAYAAADSKELASDLARELRGAGLSVWYAQDNLRPGDSLRTEIDRAIATSRHAVVILSPAFFRQEWPWHELQSLANRELHGERIIIPIWHHISLEDVQRRAPPLADRLALVADDLTPHQLADAVAGAVTPPLANGTGPSAGEDPTTTR